MPQFSRHFPVVLLALFALCPRAFALGFPGSNDNFFPPAPAAKAYINFDGKGFLIQGKRTFIVAGDIHYSRVPRALWHDRLLRIKRAGYNTIQTYTFWNFHEPREGQFDFSGDRDLDAYLKLIKQMGMYAIVRVGPYVNAEWESGGWPIWLKFKPGVIVRDYDEPYLTAMDHWLTKLFSIITPNQINHGGSVIMVQLENEDSRGAGTDLTNRYFRHLKEKAVSLGLQVPYFFSGLNHGDNPAGDQPMDTSQRISPWYSTEFWTGWIGFYGADPDRTVQRERASWRVLAYGGNGYTHYTIAGGSDFANWSCDQQAASYDFGAPIGQAGDLRDSYYTSKRVALFAQSFSDILENSVNSSPKYQSVATGVQVSARTAPAGTLLFLENRGDKPLTTQVKGDDGVLYPTAGPVNLAGFELMPIVEHYQLASGVELELAAARVLGITTQETTKTIVVYGPAGEPAEMHVQFADSTAKIASQLTKKSGASLVLTKGQAVLKTTYPKSGFESYLFGTKAHTVRVLVVNTEIASNTWFVQADGKNGVIIGPDYVGQISTVNGATTIETERRDSTKDAIQPAYLLVGTAAPKLLIQTPRSLKASPKPVVPVLSPWSVAHGDPEAAPDFKDADWKTSPEPLPMGADGDISSYAWYRTTIHAPTDGKYGLNFNDAGDWLTVYVNGTRQASSDVRQRFKTPLFRTVKVDLKAGDNQVAILTAHYGRQKLHAYVGPIDLIDSKGITGLVSLGQANVETTTTSVTQWRWKADDRGEPSASEMAAPDLNTDNGDWQNATIGQDVFGGRIGSAWFRTVLPDVPAGRHNLHFGSVDDNCVVYFNGRRILDHQGWADAFDVAINSGWQNKGPNVVAVLVQNSAGGGGIFGAVDLQTTPVGNNTPIHNWKMHGGISRPADDSSIYQSLKSGASPNTPSFYRSQFMLPAASSVGEHPILRYSVSGMTRGYVWLNGHNLGRYPEKSPVDGFYLPECWLQQGKNTIVIFDEEGQSPEKTAIVQETGASRLALELTTSTTRTAAQIR